MRIYVTGASGFVGRWLTRELEAAGHQIIEAPPSVALDITDPVAVTAALSAARPDAVAHLAGISFAGDARQDPAHAFRVNVGGTANVLEAVRRIGPPPRVLVVSSSEVYGAPRLEELPIAETAPLRASTPYALSKLGAEGVAFELAARFGIPLIVARPFNHIGPGQRQDFVVPALARRVAAVAGGLADGIAIGNAEVKRDFLDVRDVVRAYRLLLEMDPPTGEPLVMNVASGSSVSIRWIAETLQAIAGTSLPLQVDSQLVRANDPPEVVGDAARLRAATGWAPSRELRHALVEILDEVRSSGAAFRPRPHSA